MDGAVAAFGEVVNYATAETCRRRDLLKHFGETLPAAQCTGCDCCKQPDTVRAQVRVRATGGSPYKLSGTGSCRRMRSRSFTSTEM